MMLKSFVMPVIYDVGRISLWRAAPLQALTRVISDTAWGLLVGWQDCEESAQEWWDYLSGPPLKKARVGAMFFGLLGQPLDAINRYPTPWNEHLSRLSHEALSRKLGAL